MKPGALAPIAASAFSGALIVVSIGAVPQARFEWGLNLLQYLPGAASGLLAALACLAFVPATRARLIATARPVADRIGRCPPWVLGVGAGLLFWFLRERRLYGDSPILLYNAAAGSQFIFPDVGASYLFQLSHRLGYALGCAPPSGQPVVQVLVACAGGLTVAFLATAARIVVETPARAFLMVVLILASGLARVLAGHVEVYGFVLACAAASLGGAFAYARERTGIAAPALAVGATVWMHLSGIFLLPGLSLLAWFGPGATDLGARFRRAISALAIAAAPSLVFYGAMAILGHHDDLWGALQTLMRWTGIEESPVGHEAFLRLPGRDAGLGTRYVVLSGPHLRYLWNAIFLLAPSALPVLLAVAVSGPRRFIASLDAIFVGTNCAALAVYTILVRPVWGPYDWDLFSLTAVMLSTLAALFLLKRDRSAGETSAAVVLGWVSILVVALPMLWIGIAPAHEAGPFAIDDLGGRPGETPEQVLERRLSDWL